MGSCTPATWELGNLVKLSQITLHCSWASSLRIWLDVLQRQLSMKMWLERLDRLHVDTHVNTRVHGSKSLNWICLAVKLQAFRGIQLTWKSRLQDVDAGVSVVYSTLYSVQTRLTSSTGTYVSPSEDQQTSSVRHKDCICDSEISVTPFFPSPICWVVRQLGWYRLSHRNVLFFVNTKRHQFECIVSPLKQWQVFRKEVKNINFSIPPGKK